MADIFISQDAPPAWLRQKAITVFGYGAQGQAQALNLKDSGCHVTVCLYPGSTSLEKAKAAGFAVMTDPAQAARQTEIAVLLTSDAIIPQLWHSALAENLPSAAALIFAHGFVIHYNQIQPRPSQDILLVAPMGHGSVLRQKFCEGSAIPAVTAVQQDGTGKAAEIVQAYAQAIGCARVGAIASTFKEETETDLFSEQTAVVGGFVELIRASFDTMVNAGYQPEIAYWSTLRELEGMARIMANKGLAAGVAAISGTARFGALTRGPRIINATTRNELQKIMNEIQSGEFLQELQKEVNEGYPKSETGIAELKNELLDTIHKSLSS